MSLVYRILKTKSIVDYLEHKGHQPVKVLSGGKLSYLCPFADHKETKPSFIVWTNADYENFRCFGCLRNYSIINLVAELEGISYKDAITRLSDDMEINVHEDISLELDLIRKSYDDRSFEIGLSEMMLSLSSLGRGYLKGVGMDETEQGIIDKLWCEIDRALVEFDFDSIEETLEHFPVILRLRRDKFEKMKFVKMRSQYAGHSGDQTSGR